MSKWSNIMQQASGFKVGRITTAFANVRVLSENVIGPRLTRTSQKAKYNTAVCQSFSKMSETYIT